MRIVDRHILTELVGPFIFGIAAFTSLMFAGKELFQVTQLLAEFHAPVWRAVQLIALHLPGVVVLTLPMSMLLATLLGFGRLSSDSETVALFAGGVSIYRIVIPVILMAAVVTAASFALNEYIAPWTNSRHEQLVKSIKGEPGSSDKPFFVIDADSGMTNSVFFVQGGFDLSTGTLRKVALTQYLENRPAAFIYGEQAIWLGANNWEFRDGYIKTLGTKPTVMTEFSGTEARQTRIDKTPEQIALFQKKHDEMSFRQLRGYISILTQHGGDVAEYEVRLYQKIALPLATLVFALIGAPLGLRPHRSSSATGLGLSIVIIFAYWILMHYMTILGRNGSISAVAASFTPTAICAAIGVALIVRAAK